MIKLPLSVIVIVGACGLTVPSTSLADTPLPTNQHPFALVHGGVRPEIWSPSSSAALEMSSAYFWSNTYNEKSGSYVVDAESGVWETALRYPIAERVTFGLLVPVIYRGGGVLDSVIKEWDGAIGFTNQKREDARDDEFLISGKNRDGSTFLWKDSGIALGNVEVSARWDLSNYCDGVTARFRSTLPTARDTFGAESVDLGVALLGGMMLSELKLSGGVESLWFSDTEVGGVSYREFLHGGFFSGSYQFLPGWEFIVGVLASSELLADLPRTPDFDLYLDVIVERIFDGGGVSLFVRENPVSPSETTDITLGIGVRLQL